MANLAGMGMTFDAKMELSCFDQLVNRFGPIDRLIDQPPLDRSIRCDRLRLKEQPDGRFS
jgi:hypothetical protein